MRDSLLIADDDADVLSALKYLLESEGYEVSPVDNPLDVIDLLKQRNFTAMLTDLNFSKDTTSGNEGIELIQQITDLEPQLPIVAMTAWGSIETAVRAMQAGARDFVQKPWENERLISIVANQTRLAKAELKSRRLEEENKLLRHEQDEVDGEYVCKSRAMKELMQKLEQVAPSEANVLLTGENGTGKSFLVNHIHALSRNSEHPLIKVNMGAIPENLFESEMFGHIKGAFTDARETRIGRFELADEGTLFLDEIGNMPYSQQIKLLRVLEDRRFEKVGSTKTQETNCRLICATNCNLDDAVEEGSFRKDLLYRINTVEIEVPPLRLRQEDIVPLANHFLLETRRKYAKPDLQFSNDSLLVLKNYGWPGNVRELAHVVERASILAVNEIDAASLGIEASGAETMSAVQPELESLTLEEIEKRVILSRIKNAHGSNQEAASSLGISKSAFYRKLAKYKIK